MAAIRYDQRLAGRGIVTLTPVRNRAGKKYFFTVTVDCVILFLKARKDYIF